jgi:hypothetical protein
MHRPHITSGEVAQHKERKQHDDDMNSIIRKHMRSGLANDDFDVPMRTCIFDLDHLSKMTQMHNAV